ncbi:MAG: hypothetical protein HKO57_05910, partial [Akkermansiaceae bacterium]|nr:hypothetical protein [Akkermansiaceae bacterium]
MNRKKPTRPLKLAALALGLGTALGSAAGRLDLLEFDDAAGTAVTAAANTGVPGTLNHPGSGATNTFETDGNGQAVFTSAGENVFNAGNFATTLTSGKTYLRVDFAGHGLADSTTAKSFSYGFRDRATSSQLILRLVKPANNQNVRLSIHDDDNLAPASNNFTAANIDFAGRTDSLGIGTILALDLDNDTYDLFTDVGLSGTFTKVISDMPLLDGASLDNVDRLRFVVQNLEAGDTVRIGRLACSEDIGNLFLGSAVPTALPTDLYEFDDAPGQWITSADNSGDPGSNRLPFFGFNNGNTFETNGAGQAVFTSAASDQFQSRFLSTAPATTGKVFLRTDFAGHGLADSTTNKHLGFGLRDSSTQSQLVVRLFKNGGNSMRVQVLDDDGPGGAVNSTSTVNINYAGTTDTLGIGTILGLDLDSGTFDLFTDVGLSGNFREVLSGVALTTPANLQTVDGFRLLTQNLTPGDTVSVERLVYADNLPEALGDAAVPDFPVDLYDFGDPAGTSVTDAGNDGDPGSNKLPFFGFNAGNTFETDGNGRAVFTSAGANSFQSRALAPITSTGKIFLRTDFAGHGLADSSTAKIFSYGFRDSLSGAQLMLRLVKPPGSPTVRVVVFDDDGVGATPNGFNAANIGYAGLVDTAGIATILGFDLDNQTFDFYTDPGHTGALIKVFSDVPLLDPFALLDVDQLRFIAQGLETGDTVTVERIAYSDNLDDLLFGSVTPTDIDTFSIPDAEILGLFGANSAKGFTILGNGIADYSGTTDLFPIGDLSSSITSGKAFLRLDISEFTALENSFDNYQLGLQDGAGNRVSFQIAAFATGAPKRLRTITSIAGIGIDSAGVYTVPGLADDFAHSAILEIDVDADTYSVYLDSPAGYLCVFGPLPFQDDIGTPVDIGPITTVRLAVQGLEATDVVGLDFVMIDDDFTDISTYVPP